MMIVSGGGDDTVLVTQCNAKIIKAMQPSRALDAPSQCPVTPP